MVLSFMFVSKGTANPKVTFKMSEIVVDAAGGVSVRHQRSNCDTLSLLRPCAS